MFNTCQIFNENMYFHINNLFFLNRELRLPRLPVIHVLYHILREKRKKKTAQVTEYTLQRGMFCKICWKSSRYLTYSLGHIFNDT